MFVLFFVFCSFFSIRDVSKCSWLACSQFSPAGISSVQCCHLSLEAEGCPFPFRISPRSDSILPPPPSFDQSIQKAVCSHHGTHALPNRLRHTRGSTAWDVAVVMVNLLTFRVTWRRFHFPNTDEISWDLYVINIENWMGSFGNGLKGCRRLHPLTELLCISSHLLLLIKSTNNERLPFPSFSPFTLCTAGRGGRGWGGRGDEGGEADPLYGAPRRPPRGLAAECAAVILRRGPIGRRHG